MMRKIKLYGELVKITGHKELDAVVNTTAQAVSFLVNNFPELESHMSSRYYQVLLDKEEEVDIEELHFPIGKSDIKFVPVISGSGGIGDLQNRFDSTSSSFDSTAQSFDGT